MNYFINGNDEYLLNQKIKEIVKEFLKDDDFNLDYYNATDLSWQRLIDDAATFPLLGDYKVIVAENCWFLSARESLSSGDEEIILEYLERPNQSTILIFKLQGTPDRRKSIVKKINKLTQVIELPDLNPEDFALLVKRDLQKYDIRLDPYCLNELLRRLPIDLLNWQNELAKLQLHPQPLDITAIKNLIDRNISDDVFSLSDQVLAKNLGQSLLIFNDLLLKNNDPIGLAALLANNFRLIYQGKNWCDHGYSESQIAQEFAIHPYRVKLARQSAYKISKELLLEILHDFAVLDYRLKNVNCDRKLEFELLLINILERKHAFA